MTLDDVASPAAPTDCRVATTLPATTPPPLATAAADIILAATEPAAIPAAVKPKVPRTTGTWRLRRPRRRTRQRGCGRRGELLPRPLTPSAQLLEPRAGRGYVEPGWAGELLRLGPERTPAPSARRSRELCGSAAGVGARGGVHVGREGVAESGRCPVRTPPE